MQGQLAREAVGVFHDERKLQAAADELMISGFDRSELSLLPHRIAFEERTGHDYNDVAEVEDDPAAPHLAYVGADSRTEAEALVATGLGYVGAMAAAGAVVASGGTVAAATIGAVAFGAAGGLVGSALAGLIERHHDHYVHDLSARGGLPLWVRARDHEHARRARDILKRQGAGDVHVHELAGTPARAGPGVSYDVSFMRSLGL